MAKLIESTNWSYMLRELLLIVVGVTLALTATSWYESRLARREELLLDQISLALEVDLADLQARFEALRRSEQQLLSLLELLRKDELGPEAETQFGLVVLRRSGVLARLL